ncbi:MAG TPA: extracellular solute-binding protein [Nocardioidaceae bacterium]|jgi:multiple sugar transport system substrate-binding protein
MSGRDILQAGMDRRSFLKGAAAVAAAGAGVPLLDACGSGGGESGTLRVFTQTGPPIASAVAASAAPFKKKTGVKVELITAPFGQLYTKTLADFTTGGGSYDVVLCASSWLGDLHPFIVDLTDRVKNDSSLQWDDVIYQGNAQWNGRQVAIPIDGDNQLCYYRRDIIGDKGLSKKFQKEFGKPLAPPETWDDFMNIARFFGDGKYGVHGVVEAYRHGGQAFWYFASNCIAYCAAPNLPGAMWFNPANLEPLVNNPGHVKGMENYAEAVKYGPPGMINFDSNEVRQRFAHGEAVLGIDWDDTPIIGELQSNSKVKGKIGSQLLPGSSSVYDYKKEAWVDLPQPNRPGWLAFGGWVGVIPQSASDVDTAYKYLSFLAGPDFSMKMVTRANSGMNPFRSSHLSNLDAWKNVGYPEPDLQLYLDAMRKSDTDPHAVTDLRLPGAATFQDDTEVAAQQVVSGQKSAQDALDGLAAQWNALNERKGKSKQLKEYRASLNTKITSA